ncbi:MAG TPA: translation elongation factor G [Firmicutes bacterium]|nr:translation elongation factor G [Bacillota bacterium]
MKKLVIGILAHVDAGKTTLSESMLYLSGKIKRLGRVDKKDAYLDTHDLERERGITIFSKQALLQLGNIQVTLLDTPGHVDFSAEMERTLQVLDYAILVISGADGVQGHTATLWDLLGTYKVPAFVFINKMDQPGADQDAILGELKSQLDGGCIAFAREDDLLFDQLAMCDERLMEAYLERGRIAPREVKRAVFERKVFPCFFGSALKLDGVEQFMAGMTKLISIPFYPREFGAKVFKISRDDQGNRLTHMKLTGGSLKVRDAVANGDWEEKVNQIRIYSGEKFEVVDLIESGSICAVTGLSQAKPGEGLGIEASSHPPVLEPVLAYQVLLPEDLDARVILPKLRQLEEEEPGLSIVWDEQLQEIQAQIMGDVQIEVLQSLIRRRFDVEVSFDAGRILYKETITTKVEGVGHFEPLRHYAEVHLVLEPREAGSGLQFVLDCSEDILAKNWQRLILSHLGERTHKGVLTGSAITDMKISVVSGRAHTTHTDGGDFREATFRAVRQGLKEAESILLEPYYRFRLEVPEKMIGRAMTDIERMHGDWEIVETSAETAVLAGSAPVATMRNYHRELVSYTKGLGRLFLDLGGYRPCHNSQEIIASAGYDSERDIEHPTGSIFCSQGTGFYVPWDQVKDCMHLDRHLKSEEDPRGPVHGKRQNGLDDLEEDDYRYLDTIANRGKKVGWNRLEGVPVRALEPEEVQARPAEERECYLLVDGYNVIHAWPDLKELALGHMDAARTRLLNMLSSYQGIKRCRIIVVFDAYGVVGHLEEIIDYHNIHVVFTKEAQTADEYIEKFAYDHQKKYDISVATSDALQQVIIRGAGSALVSARELREEIDMALENARRSHEKRQRLQRTHLEDTLSPEVKKRIEDLV